MSEYDPGLLNDFGGGNVQWWHDYIRAELGRSEEFYQSAIAEKDREIERLKAELNAQIKRPIFKFNTVQGQFLMDKLEADLKEAVGMLREFPRYCGISLQKWVKFTEDWNLQRIEFLSRFPAKEGE